MGSVHSSQRRSTTTHHRREQHRDDEQRLVPERPGSTEHPPRRPVQPGEDGHHDQQGFRAHEEENDGADGEHQQEQLLGTLSGGQASGGPRDGGEERHQPGEPPLGLRGIVALPIRRSEAEEDLRPRTRWPALSGRPERQGATGRRQAASAHPRSARAPARRSALPAPPTGCPCCPRSLCHARAAAPPARSPGRRTRHRARAPSDRERGDDPASCDQPARATVPTGPPPTTRRSHR